MSITPQADPAESIDTIRQKTFDALRDLLNSARTAKDNLENSDDARRAANDVYNAANDQLDALELAKFEENTIDLQACGNDLKGGMDELEKLRDSINAVANGMKEAASILCKIDDALGYMRKVVAFL